jgi:hypothetical protein
VGARVHRSPLACESGSRYTYAITFFRLTYRTPYLQGPANVKELSHELLFCLCHVSLSRRTKYE